VIDVVGVPAEGLAALGPRQHDLVRQARTLVGSPRLLGLLPEHGYAAVRLPWPTPLLAGLPDLLAAVGSDGVVVLATGDPLRSGIGSTLIRLLGPPAVRIHPAVSSVALARARLGWSAEQTEVISLVSAPVAGLGRLLAPGARIVALSAGARTPVEIGRWLTEQGCGASRLVVLGDLGTDAETRLESTADDLAAAAGARGIPALNVVAIEVTPDARVPGPSPGRPDDDFEHDGQLTKREFRALALAALRPLPGQLLWDLGAGSGSVGIEWCLAAPRARALAVERDPQRAARIERNAAAYGVAVTVVAAPTQDALAQPRPAPDAVFVGGGASVEVIDTAWAALRPGGRIVVHAVTLGTEALAVAAHAAHGGELRRVTVERAQPLGSALSWTPARPIVQWSAIKEHDQGART
jgi:precorrin-6Y C5,15-methyltransferase (decarboxylating)